MLSSVCLAFLLALTSSDTLSGEFRSCKEGSCANYAQFDHSTFGRVQPTGLFSNQMDEVDFAECAVVGGKVPVWLEGSMYKVGVGAFEMGGRRVSNVIDALSKVYRWSFLAGKAPTFSTKFLKTGIYNRSVAGDELVAHKVLGDIYPPLSTFEKIKMTLWDARRDNNNITPWKLKGREGITVTGEGPLYFDVDVKDLDFLEKYTIVDSGAFVKEFMSASHFAKHPSTGDSYNYIYLSGLDKGLLTGVEPAYQMIKFKDAPDGQTVGEIVGSIPVPLTDMRIVHSIGITESYVILPRLSLKVILNSTTHVCDNIVFDHKTPTVMHVMSLSDGSYKTFEFPPFISVHIINAFERENAAGDTEIVVDYPTLTTTHDFPDHLCYYQILNVDYILDDDFKYREEFRPLTDVTIRRFVMNMRTGDGQVIDHPQMWQPRILHIDFPYMNDLYRGKPYCFVYLHTIQWDNRNAMGILKLDLCNQRSVGWDDLNLFPVEPVFVPRPGAKEEDDGVLMAPVYDTQSGKSELYIWDAKDLKVLARVAVPVRVPWTNHGLWVPE